MKTSIRIVLGAVIFAGLAMTSAHAQAPAAPPPPPPVPDGPRYVVGYVEVMPSAKDQGAALIRQYRDAARKEGGNLRVEAARRIGVPHQFVVLEAWKDQAAFDAHAKAPTTMQFRDKLKAIQNAPYDERVHFALSVGPLPATFGGAAIVVVTHVDVIPPQRENGTGLVKQLAEDSRKDDGNLRFEAVTQTNRQNHFSVVEAWKNHSALDTHSMNAKTRGFRDNLAPAIGALYDERLYKVVN